MIDPLVMRPVFVTGATGLVGTHLVRRLLQAGQPVRLLVRDPDRASLPEDAGCSVVQGDITRPATLHGVMGGCDQVVHAAAMVEEVTGDRRALHRVNVSGTRNVLRAAQASGVSHCLLVSSLAVLGGKDHHGTTEGAPYAHTGDPYLESKIAAEKAALQFTEEKGIPVTIIRPTYVYGPGDRQFFPRVVRNMLERKMIYVDDGLRPMSVTHARNLAEGIRLALARSEAWGEIYHVTDGVLISRREILETVAALAGTTPPVVSTPASLLQVVCNGMELVAHIRGARQPPVLNRFRYKFLACHLDFPIDRARRELGYQPLVTPQEGIPETIAWLRQERPELFVPPEKPGSLIETLFTDKRLVSYNADWLARQSA